MSDSNQMIAEAESETRKVYSVSQTGSPLLEYETPRKPPPGDSTAATVRFFQRLISAVGAGCFAYGVVCTYIGRTSDAPEFVGWGAALCVLGSPWGWKRPNRSEN